MTNDAKVEESRAELRAAWDDLIADMQLARDVIDDPKYLGPPPTERVLAEGYRYLTGFIHHGIERSFHEDPNFPAFRNALSVFNKSTIENSDAIYFYSPIDGSKHYRITAKVEDARHWRGAAAVQGEAKAPQYLIFECSGGPMAGDTGTLAELVPGKRTGFGTLDCTTMELGPNGELEIHLGPERPEGYEGHYFCTRKPPRKGDESGQDRYATYISGRQLFYDWEFEEPIHIDIQCLDTLGASPAALTPASSAAHLRHMGAIIRGQMHFWMEFYDKLLNVHGTYPADGGRYFMPVNEYNKPNGASGDTAGGMSTNIYAGGLYELAEDEALYVEATFTGKPVYTSMHLGNMWGESPDYANNQSSLNLHQMYIGNDGKQRWLVAHQDPGVQNWIDTTGLPKGFLSHRWAYAELPPESEWPTIKAQVIKLSDVDKVIPADMPRTSVAERKREIGVRQAHVRKRFRVF